MSTSSFPAPWRRCPRRCSGCYGRSASIYNLLSQAGRFGLSAQAADAETDRIVEVIRHWRDSLFACGVSAQDIGYIAFAILPDCFFFEIPPDA